MRGARWERAAAAYARLALGAAFLSGVASRFGLWGRHVGYGTWENFVRYTAQVNAFMPAATIPYLAWAATIAELALGVALVVGVWPRGVALASAGLLALFAGAMTLSMGIKEPLDYSVFSASAAALLLAGRPRGTRLAVALGACLTTMPVRSAEAQRSPARVSAQGAYGTRFDDAVYGLNTASGRLRTLLLDADAPWQHGQNLFFLRLFSGDFVDARGVATGQRVIMYAEGTSRLSLLPRARRDSAHGVVRDLFVAGGINRGSSGARANLVGAGVKLQGPGRLFTISSLYYRRAAGDRAGIKERTSWALPIDAGPLALSFDGSVDVITRTSSGTDVSAMPALVADVGRLVGLPRETVALGSEWFLHRARGARLVAPQMVVRWVF
jgi:uncharacterized membrane protein YphA (DoxX/SURF4 family)